jgi:hypothetical protein
LPASPTLARVMGGRRSRSAAPGFTEQPE